VLSKQFIFHYSTLDILLRWTTNTFRCLTVIKVATTQRVTNDYKFVNTSPEVYLFVQNMKEDCFKCIDLMFKIQYI
jgi:hypothetical protein